MRQYCSLFIFMSILILCLSVYTILFMDTILFSLIFFITIFISLYKNSNSVDDSAISREDTTGLKGIAFLMVFFSHITYFLFPYSNFLFPLSMFAGVGGNLFLFLSGYGLVKSSQDKSPMLFYKKRLSKLYIPLFITTIFITILDLISGIPFSFARIFPGLTAIVPSADIYTDFNSPLWFLTLLILFYVVFPFLFNKEKPIRSSIFFLLFGGVIPGYITQFLPLSSGVIHLYAVHAYAFPLGVILAFISMRIDLKKKLFKIPKNIRIFLWCIVVTLFIYTSFHAAINTSYEQLVSLCIMVLFLCVVLFLPLRSKFILIVGIYSYELYLLHRPLLYRHDVLYRFFPHWLATYLYIFVLLGVGFIIAKVSSKILEKKIPST